MKKLFVFMCIGCLCVTMLTAQELENGVREAVSRFAMRLLRPLDVRIGAMTLEGKDTPSGFSLYLYNLVYYYVDENPSFRIVNVPRGPTRPDEQQRGLFKGTFAKRGNMVEVYLYLVSETDERSYGTQRITFPLAELTARDISIEPENPAEIEEQQKIFAELNGTGTENPNVQPANTNPVNQSINIQASFNSQSMTYFHRDELQITVMADRDCYFKIIHIDANNQMKMIYPNSSDRNNRLLANVPRTIFETASYMLYEPYGAEVILVVSSSRQFENIEREYIAPWIPATANSVRTAVRGERGGELESQSVPITFSGEGEARYDIYIQPPHDEYTYGRPENMRETYQSMRDDVQRQGGTFTGNDTNYTSAYYILNGVRGSYRIPRDAPDTIQFVFYYLDNYTRGPNAGVRTRGAGFSFSFERPANLTQTIRTVRTRIESIGGTFTGNEQQGNFRANGITGQYRVSDRVNVTITEKPFVIPNSLIEREVRSYFGGR